MSCSFEVRFGDSCVVVELCARAVCSVNDRPCPSPTNPYPSDSSLYHTQVNDLSALEMIVRDYRVLRP